MLSLTLQNLDIKNLFSIQLQRVRVSFIFLLLLFPQKENLTQTKTGTHPTDLGMKAVANFYTDLIPKIFSSNSSVRVDTYSSPTSSSPTTSGHTDETTHWIDVSDNEIPVVGRGFSGETFENYFNRLPLQSKTDVREKVWELSKFSTGMGVAFTTDSPSISIEYILENDAEGLWHMCRLERVGWIYFDMMSWIRKCTGLSARQLRRFRNIMRPLSYLFRTSYRQLRTCGFFTLLSTSPVAFRVHLNCKLVQFHHAVFCCGKNNR